MEYVEPVEDVTVTVGDDGTVLVSWKPATRMVIGMTLSPDEARTLANKLLNAAVDAANVEALARLS